MKITRVETLCLSRIHEPERQWFVGRTRVIKADCAIVIIHTDEGLQGIGEASAYGWPLVIRGWVDWLAKEMVGKDPLDPAIVPHPHGVSRAADCAAAGMDCALWDLRGKIAGRPTRELLTKQPLNKVRLYASAGCSYDWQRRPEQLIEEALGYIAQGYTAMKFRTGTDWDWNGVTVDRFLGLVRELSQAVDGRMELMLDDGRFTEEQALAVAKELDRLCFAWFEEPISPDQIAGYARIAAAVDMPISGGERLTTVQQFRPYVEHKAYDIVQPDAGLCGITEAMKIGMMAHNHYGLITCPHSWHNGLMAMANAQVVASLPCPKVLELCMIQGPLQWEILAQKPIIEKGWLVLPDKPGLGVELAPDLEDRFPYIEGHYAIEVTR